MTLSRSPTKAYGLSVSAARLPGENLNFLLEGEDGRRYVLKVAGEGLPDQVIDLEHRMIERLISAGIELELPRILPNQDGRIESTLKLEDGSSQRARLLAFVGGTAWDKAGDPTPKRLRDLGSKLARIDLVLDGMDHPAAHRTHRWDLANASQHREKVALIETHAERRLVEWGFHLHAAGAASRLKALPHAIIHGDANDENILVDGERIVGLLDFADSLYNPVVCELAIALAYAMLDLPEPLEKGAEIVRSYDELRPLSPDEIEVLFPLVCGRLSTTVAVAAGEAGSRSGPPELVRDRGQGVDAATTPCDHRAAVRRPGCLPQEHGTQDRLA